MTCIKDGEALVKEVEVAYADFKKENTEGVKAGIIEVGEMVKTIAGGVKDCGSGVSGIENLVHMAEGFASPWSFAYHVGKDLLVNGVEIFHEVEDAVDQYEAGNFEGFGEDIGKALAQVFVGEARTGYMLATADVEAILLGIVDGALTQSLPDFGTCLTDIETTAADIETAVKDFEKETFNGVKDGIEMVGTVVTQLSTDLTDC